MSTDKEHICIFCGSVWHSDLGRRRHQKFCKNNPERMIIRKRPGTGCNQHMKAKKEGRVFEVSAETRAKLSKSNTGKVMSPEVKAKLSNSMKKAVLNNPESYTSSNRGRTKQIERYGIKFQGSWELIFYEYCVATGIKVERCKERFDYVFNGLRTYNPDFYLPETGLYVEVKGYETDQDRAKWRDFPRRLVIVRREQITAMKDFVDSELLEVYSTEKDKEIRPTRHEKRKMNTDKKWEHYKEIVLHSSIDFSKLGWVHKVAELLGIQPAYVNRWMKKYLPEFYINCFVRKYKRPCISPVF